MTTDTDNTDDPFFVLESAAKKQEAHEKVLERISKARTRLVLSKSADYAFWASLALRLRVESSDTEVDTLGTDGERLVCNPEFVASLTDDERVAVVAHEVAHCAHNHMGRVGHRDHDLFNIAGDLVINPLLTAAGFKLPQGQIMPGQGKYKDIPAGLSTEETYQKLLDRKKQDPGPNGDEPSDGQGDGQGKPKGDPGRCGQVMPPPDPSDAGQREMEGQWKVAVAQAHNQAKQRGQLSAGLERLVAEVLEPVVNWREVLREFVTRQARSDYSWSPPNRRFVYMGLYLPSVRSEELGEVVLAIDTSGSISDATMSRFVSEIQGILEAFADAKLTILFHTSEVYNVQRWEGSDGPIVLEKTQSGGTDHRPVFQRIEDDDMQPTCLICLTDMASCWPATAPDYPVLFCSIEKGQTAPFGQLLEIT